jgi:hypothetical protein
MQINNALVAATAVTPLTSGPQEQFGPLLVKSTAAAPPRGGNKGGQRLPNCPGDAAVIGRNSITASGACVQQLAGLSRQIRNFSVAGKMQISGLSGPQRFGNQSRSCLLIAVRSTLPACSRQAEASTLPKQEFLDLPSHVNWLDQFSEHKSIR